MTLSDERIEEIVASSVIGYAKCVTTVEVSQAFTELQQLRKRIEAAKKYIEVLEFELKIDEDDEDTKQAREEWLNSKK